MTNATFQQAAIPVQKQDEFQRLHQAFDRIFGPAANEFLSKLQSRGLQVRQYERVLASGVIEQFATEIGPARAEQLYESLPLSDQAQIREHYLLRLEQVGEALRNKFAKVYIDQV